MLVENGAPVDIDDDSSIMTAILRAAYESSDVAAQELCDAGADMNLTNRTYHTWRASRMADWKA